VERVRGGAWVVAGEGVGVREDWREGVDAGDGEIEGGVEGERLHCGDEDEESEEGAV